MHNLAWKHSPVTLRGVARFQQPFAVVENKKRKRTIQKTGTTKENTDDKSKSQLRFISRFCSMSTSSIVDEFQKRCTVLGREEKNKRRPHGLFLSTAPQVGLTGNFQHKSRSGSEGFSYYIDPEPTSSS
jgi:hypothetical protein